MAESKVPQEQSDVAPEIGVPTKPTSEFLDRAKLELELRLQFRQEYEQILLIWKNTELVALEKRQEEAIAKGLKNYFEEWKKEQKPPEPENIQSLLDQVYAEFRLPVDYVDANGDVQKEVFTIRELPQRIEKEFYRRFKKNLLEKISELEALVQSEMEHSFEDKMKAGLTLFDESFDVMAEAVTLILNPFGRNTKINAKWVQDNISSH